MTAAQVALLFAALLALRRPPAAYHACIDAHAVQIVTAGNGAEAIGVPASVLLAVGRRESHWACAPGEGSWGAPRPRTARQRRIPGQTWRHIAGTPMDAARALASSYAVCGEADGAPTWTMAVGRFRSGLCHPWQLVHRRYVASVIHDVEIIHTRTGIAPPTHLR